MIDARIRELNQRISELLEFNNRFEERARKAERAIKDLRTPRPASEYHEDMGDVLWWKFPIEEAPYCGSPNDLGHDVVAEITIATALKDETKSVSFMAGGWPGYHTHWTPLPIVKDPQ